MQTAFLNNRGGCVEIPELVRPGHASQSLELYPCACVFEYMNGEDIVAASTADDVPREVPRNSKWQLGLCKYFVNTGKCPKGSECKCVRYYSLPSGPCLVVKTVCLVPSPPPLYQSVQSLRKMPECKRHMPSLNSGCCRYNHPAAEDLKAARAEWLQARKQRRQLVSWAEGNPHAFEAAKKGRRAAVLADWLVDTYGKDLLNSGSGVTCCMLASSQCLAQIPRCYMRTCSSELVLLSSPTMLCFVRH